MSMEFSGLGQHIELMKKLDQIIERMPEPAPTPDPLPSSVEQTLRDAAADWMETDIGYVYGQTIIDILEGR